MAKTIALASGLKLKNRSKPSGTCSTIPSLTYSCQSALPTRIQFYSGTVMMSILAIVKTQVKLCTDFSPT